jgi:transmembrane sensor
VTASTNIDERLLDEAVAWHRALDAEDADWDGYTLWLEADPRHREAFDAIALTDRIVADHAGRLREILVDEREPVVPKRRLAPRWIFGAVAALAIGITVPMTMTMMPSANVTYDSGANPRRIALATGISVDLAPSSILRAKGGDIRNLELARGEAYFDVAHDPNRVLSIQAGRYTVSDIGTRFAVNMSNDAVIVGR